MKKLIRVIQYGLGPIGVAAARLVMSRPGLKLVGVVDVDPEIVGKDLGNIPGMGARRTGIKVVDSIGKCRKADVAVHCAGSRMPGIYDQLGELARHGLDVVSSAEELLYPWFAHPGLARKLEKLCLGNKVTMLDTGVNPGFVMDTMALATTGVCHEVRGIRVTRIVNAATRRKPLQLKVGAGNTLPEFRAKVKNQQLGHVGLLESIALIGHGLGLKLDITDRIRPKVAPRRFRTKHLTVQKGQAAGIEHQGWGKIDGKTFIHLHLEMFVGDHESYDEIIVKGTPPMHVRFEGGTAGDPATVGVLVNGISKVYEGNPGLITMVDGPVHRAFGSILP